MLKSILPLSLTTFLSRMTGFFRDYVLYHLIGPGPALDVFFVAFRFPQLTRRFFAEGSFHQALLPVMANAMENGENTERAHNLYSTAFWFVTFVMLALSLSMWWKPFFWINYVLAPGFSSSQKELLASCLQWTTPYSLGLAWVSLLALLLQMKHSYWLNGLSPTILNILVIAAAYIKTQDVILTAQSVFIAGWLQALLHSIFVAKTFSLSYVFPKIQWPQQDFLQVWSRFLSLSGLSLLILFNMTIDQIFLSYAPVGSVSVYYLCERMIEVPIGVIGYSLWSVFSTYYAQNHKNKWVCIRLEYHVLLLILSWVVPAAAFLFFFAPDIMSFFMGAQAPLVAQASSLLHIVSLQILMIVINKIFVIIFTTQERNTEILAIHGLGSAVNLIANSLLYPFGARGIAFSTVCTLAIQLFAFNKKYPLLRRLYRLPLSALSPVVLPLVLFIGVMALCVYLKTLLISQSFITLAILSVLTLSTTWYFKKINPFFHQINQRLFET